MQNFSMQNFLLTFILFFLPILVEDVLSENNPYKLKFTATNDNLSKLVNSWNFIDEAETNVEDKNIFFSFKAPSLGRVKIKLISIRKPNWGSFLSNEDGQKKDPNQYILLNGRVISNHFQSLIITGSLHKTSKGTVIHFHIPSDANKQSRLTSLRFSVSTRTAKFSTHPARSLFKDKTCSVNGSSQTHTDVKRLLSDNTRRSKKAPKVVRATALKIIRLSTEADFDRFKRFGQETNGIIAGIVESGSKLYEKDFGIRFRIVKQNVFTNEASDPYKTSNAESLLNTFQNYTLTNRHLGEADLYHFFTGKDLSGSTIGIAFMSVVCKNGGRLSFGISQHVQQAADPTVFKHEVGHNLGADHDTSNLGTIMYPAMTNPIPSEFSSFSKNQITRFLSTIACLGDASANPQQPAPTSIPPTAIPTIRPTVFIPTPPAQPTPTIRPANPPTGIEVDLKARARISKRGSFSVRARVRSDSSCTIRIFAVDKATKVVELARSNVGIKSFRVKAKNETSSTGSLLIKVEAICEGAQPLTVEAGSIELNGAKEDQKVSLDQWLAKLVNGIEVAQR
jgi:hypothetical protein